MTKSLLRHDTKQSRKAALEEVSLQTTAECGQRRADITCCGGPFYTWAAAMGKVLSSMVVDRRIHGMASDDDDAERTQHHTPKSAD